ncbi:MAG: putative phage abortive infection protein [Verrucomicrobiota bacterium]
MNLHNQNVSQMRISVEQFASVSSNEYDGRKCFQILHNLLHAVYGTSRTAEQNADVNFAANFYLRMFEVYEASLGHYFRTLYHVIKFVNESDALKTDNTDADYKNRRRYTSLVRAQLSAFELELLFYNGISPHGEKFKPLIEKFGLLENFDTKHLLSPSHESFYAKTAFE